MTTQLEPSLCNSAHAPSVAGRMAVPAVALVLGTTLEATDTTACAWIVLIMRRRPGNAAADGSVALLVAARLEMMLVVVAATVKSPVSVTGAVHARVARIR